MSIEDLQKKIIPWHVLLPSREDLEDTSEIVRARKSGGGNTKGLILVASLVDKGTNLGGISRTCEIFNVKELVGKYLLNLDILFNSNIVIYC